LRNELRRLAESGQAGVIHLTGGERWARILLEGGRVLGVYTDDAAGLVPTLAPLAEVLSDPELRAGWHAASGGPPLDLPTSAEAERPVSPLERQLVWIVSRFEAGWSRARDEGGTPGELVATLREMAEALSTLAAVAEAAAGDPVELEGEIAALPIARARPQDQAQIGARLSAAGQPQALPTLVEIVSEALRRIVRASAEPSIATCCRQAAGVLEAELRAAFAPPAQSKSASTSESRPETSLRAGGDA
jgi:hypothetical protein